MTPTQEDREAAAEWSFGRTDFASFSPADRFEVEEVAKFIAGIRLAAEERGARMALEAAVAAIDEGIDCDGIIVSDIARLDPAAIVGGHPDE